MKLTLKSIGNAIDVSTQETKYFLVLEDEAGAVLQVATTEDGVQTVVAHVYAKPPTQETPLFEGPSDGGPSEVDELVAEGAQEFGGNYGQDELPEEEMPPEDLDESGPVAVDVPEGEDEVPSV